MHCVQGTFPPSHTQHIQAVSTLLIPQPLRRAVLAASMRTFTDPFESVTSDVSLLRHSPLMPRDIPIHGLVSKPPMPLHAFNCACSCCARAAHAPHEYHPSLLWCAQLQVQVSPAHSHPRCVTRCQVYDVLTGRLQHVTTSPGCTEAGTSKGAKGE